MGSLSQTNQEQVNQRNNYQNNLWKWNRKWRETNYQLLMTSESVQKL